MSMLMQPGAGVVVIIAMQRTHCSELLLPLQPAKHLDL